MLLARIVTLHLHVPPPYHNKIVLSESQLCTILRNTACGSIFCKRKVMVSFMSRNDRQVVQWTLNYLNRLEAEADCVMLG